MFLASVLWIVWAAAALRAAEPPAAAKGEAPPDTMAARVQGCATCHGKRGEGTQDDYFPRIAGKPKGYLFNQLRNFHDGHRSYPPMNYLLAYLHDDYFNDMAEYYASEELPFAAPEVTKLSAAQMSLGAALVRTGVASRGIPACMTCHGVQLTGINPGIPGLIGLHSRYISAQLESWRIGTRRAAAPDCMHDVARLLTEAEITAVAGWLAAQPAPPNHAPAQQGSWKTPLLCGSQPQ